VVVGFDAMIIMIALLPSNGIRVFNLVEAGRLANVLHLVDLTPLLETTVPPPRSSASS
jgi:hypothetical protein